MVALATPCRLIGEYWLRWKTGKWSGRVTTPVLFTADGEQAALIAMDPDTMTRLITAVPSKSTVRKPFVTGRCSSIKGSGFEMQDDIEALCGHDDPRMLRRASVGLLRYL